MRIESIRLKNFRMFRDVTIAKLSNCSVFIGANGTGKSSLFDVFGFLHDALIYNVKSALAKRGGFKEVVSRGTSGPLELEFKFRDLKTTSSQVTYLLVIELLKGKPVISREVLKYQWGRGETRHFLDFSFGQGVTYENDSNNKPGAQETCQQESLTSPDILALQIMGQLQRFEIASELRQFIENWHFSDLKISKTSRVNQIHDYADEHLSSTGDNIAYFAHFMYHNYPNKYQEILQKMVRRVPGFATVEPVIQNRQILLKFQDKNFQEPFLAWQVSDGTMQLFAHLLLLHDPNPHPLLCVEEPDTQLYPDTLMILAEEFSLYSKKGEGQVFVSTHSPDFLNGVHLDSIYWLTKKDNYTQVYTTAKEGLLQRLIEVGDLPGALWTEGFFEGARSPKL